MGFFYYGGAGMGLGYLDLSGQELVKINLGSFFTTPDKEHNLSAHKFTPAGQVFLGVGYAFNDQIAIRAGGKALLAHSIEATSSEGKTISKTDNLQYAFEVALSIKF